MQTDVQAANGKVTKAERTRARLIEVAKRLYQEHGSDHVTVRRIAAAASPAEHLFALAMLGDDRAVAHTYVMGRHAYSRV